MEEAEFLFSLMKDDTVELEKDGNRSVYRVKKLKQQARLRLCQPTMLCPTSCNTVLERHGLRCLQP